ncbi:MAG: uracil-DNA glycosylase family protein [Candidatus Micrarchaeia archaeon]
MKFEFSAGAVIWKKDNNKRYFLVLIKENNEYDIPKGHIEKGETAEIAALREVKEETNLDVKFIPFFKHTIQWWFVENGEKIKKYATFFLAERLKEEDIKVSFEHKSYKWLTVEEIEKTIPFKTTIELIKTANDYLNRIDAMVAVNEEYEKLPEYYPNWNLSKNFVPGEGPLNAKIMVIGQAPGKNEDEQKRPFVGRAGLLLNELLKLAKLKRDKVYITSVVQFFPPKNRAPTEEEINYCIPFLKKQIKIIKPKFIILLGNISAYSVGGINNVMKNHGKVFYNKEYDCELFITIHPAAAVRIKKNVFIIEEDFKKFKDILNKNENKASKDIKQK